MVVDLLNRSIDPELVRIVDKEGDHEEWIDEYSGYPCIIHRVKPYGCWCGYVRVPEAHNCFDKYYDDIDVYVHGGLTFSGNSLPDWKHEKETKGWLGFDCGHAGDIIPYLWKEGTYRTKEYVKQECTELAKQLKDLEGC